MLSLFVGIQVCDGKGMSLDYEADVGIWENDFSSSEGILSPIILAEIVEADVCYFD